MHQGSCLCGAVRFEVSMPLPPPDACHCQECRKFSGHYFVSTDVFRSAVTVHGSENVTWYRTDKVRRGFCSTCGSSLFWDPPHDKDWTAIALGCFDPPTHTQISKHIFVANKGDYYEITDDIPQSPQFPKN
ncbi:GFA family protein [bacterium]|nr:GFA family protein [bacterium]